MTAPDKARELLGRLRMAALSENTLYGGTAGNLYDDAADAISAALASHSDAAVEAEREACAKVAVKAAEGECGNDMFDDGWDAACEHIASAIRSRVSTESPNG